MGSKRTDGDLDRLPLPFRLCWILDADDDRWNLEAEFDRDRGLENPPSVRLRPVFCFCL